jgi:hypothetical protein
MVSRASDSEFLMKVVKTTYWAGAKELLKGGCNTKKCVKQPSTVPRSVLKINEGTD